MKKIAVFASGFGSNFEAIVEAAEKNILQAEIVLLVTDKPDCYAVERAKNHHVAVLSFQPKTYSSKEEYETMIADELLRLQVDLIVLAGYMRLIGSVLLSRFPEKIINIHPALLPAFPGTHAIEKAFAYGVKIYGITIHYVDAGMDSGKIIEQSSFKADGSEHIEEIETKIHELEHYYYPLVIQQIIK